MFRGVSRISCAFLFQERRFREEMRRAKREETNSATVVHVNPSPPNILHGCYNAPGSQYGRITLILVHIFLSSFFALPTYLTHIVKQLCLCCKMPSQMFAELVESFLEAGSHIPLLLQRSKRNKKRQKKLARTGT